MCVTTSGHAALPTLYLATSKETVKTLGYGADLHRTFRPNTLSFAIRETMTLMSRLSPKPEYVTKLSQNTLRRGWRSSKVWIAPHTESCAH